MNKLSTTGKLLAFIGVGVFAFGTVLMVNDDGGILGALGIPLTFVGILVIMASILFIGNLSKKAFHTNNFIFLFMLVVFNSIALFGAAFSNTIGSETYFGTGLSYVIWGIFYFLQFVRPNKVWRISWFLIMVIFLFFWQTGLGYKIGLMIF